MDASRRLCERSIKDGFEVDSQKFMGVPLLAYSVAVPYLGQSSQYRQRICLSFLVELTNKLTIATLIAVLPLIPTATLFLVHSGQAVLVEQDRVGQALHHSVEEACVAVVHHRQSDSRERFLVLPLDLETIGHLFAHLLKSAGVTSFWYSPHRRRGMAFALL